MADTLDTTQPPRRLLVDGRDPFADETVTTDDPSGALLTIDTTSSPGQTLVVGTAGANGSATITVTPGSEDTNRTAGSDIITVTTPAPPTPLVVTLE
jgi:hypothetical protein